MDIDFGHESFDEDDDDAFETGKDSDKGGSFQKVLLPSKKCAKSLSCMIQDLAICLEDEAKCVVHVIFQMF